MPLPVLLAGPILRRVESRLVESRLVVVWVALADSGRVRLDVYEGLQHAGSGTGTAAVGAQPVLSATVDTRRFGAHLHVGLPVAELAAEVAAEEPRKTPLRPGTLYSYNVAIDTMTMGSHDLKSLGLLTGVPGGAQALGYSDGLLPSFATAPAALERLVLLQASCNKLHGLGDGVTGHLDDLIADSRSDPLTRPHQLFLTGDQIYADDVPAALLPALNRVGRLLIGGNEQLPGVGAAMGPYDATLENFPTGQRQGLVAAAKLTSSDADNHLLSFGEFAALYLATWSPEFWKIDEAVLAVAGRFTGEAGDDLASRIGADVDAGPTNAPAVLAPPPPSPLAAALTRLFESTPEARRELTRAREAFLKHKEALRESLQDVWHLRRALANVPTLMVCDDHEVTDDWNLTGDWHDRVLGQPLGRAIVRNGLAAFVVFQAWGNDPKAFDAPSTKANLLDAIGEMVFDSAEPAQGADLVDAILGLNAGIHSQVDFSVRVTGPVHEVVMLDTRTRRGFPHPESPPELLSRQALEDQLPAGPRPAGSELLVVVSPAPVLGPALIDEVLLPLGVRVIDAVNAIRDRRRNADRTAEQGLPVRATAGAEFFDREGWANAPVALERLLQRLATHERVLVLSGDVHYGATLAMDYVLTAGPVHARITQLTSSAAHNAHSGRIRSLIDRHRWTTILQLVGRRVRRLGWKDANPPVLTGLAATNANGVTVVLPPSGEPLSLRGRLWRSPVLLPPHGWRGTHLLARPPDWYWELQAVADYRPTAQRPEAARPKDITEPDLPRFPDVGQPPIDLLRGVAPGRLGYGRLAQLHQMAVRELNLARGVVFQNNVGKVTFSRTGAGGYQVSHALYSSRAHPEPNEDPEAYVVHTVSLDSEKPLPPTEVTA